MRVFNIYIYIYIYIYTHTHTHTYTYIICLLLDSVGKIVANNTNNNLSNRAW
jgi:hypothetical protein